MYISDYQIHNVLKVYSKQLTRTQTNDSEKAVDTASKTDKINLSAEGKRRAIIDKVAKDIVSRIMQFGPKEKVDHEIVSRLKDEFGENVDFDSEKANNFVFNVIDGNNEKKMSTLEVEDSRFLVNRLEQLAKKVVDKRME
jgi:hypothetical protein